LEDARVYLVEDYISKSEPNKNFCNISFYLGNEGGFKLFVEESSEYVMNMLEEFK